MPRYQTFDTANPKRQPNAADLEATIQNQVRSLRSRAAQSFSARAPWLTESMADQYYFDLTAYAFWKTAAALLPNYVDRDLYMRELGRSIYQELLPSLPLNSRGANGSLTGTVACVNELLSALQSTNFCTSFRLGETPKSKDEPAIFLDEIEQDAYLAGATVDALLSIINAATLGSSLQITGEQSRFIPDLCGPTLAALWEYQLPGCSVTWETYFVDPEYRPNPKDYFPNEQLFQFSLAKKK